MLAAAVFAALIVFALGNSPAHAAEPPVSPSEPLTLTLASLRPAPATNGPIKPALPNPMRRPGQAPIIAVGPVYGPSYYYVQPTDTIGGIAGGLGIDTGALMAANGMTWPGSMVPGYLLRVPGPDGSLPPWASVESQADGTLAVALRKDVVERLTPAARAAGPDSPYYNKTWVTYYGRPGIPLMGIIGEQSAADIMPLIKAKAAEYDEANGPKLGVQPAVHLVWGMATVDPQPDNSHLGYLAEAEVMPYIEEGLKAGVDVILDSQIANLSPTASISPALPYLKYPNVHLAIDPEFAVVHKGQYIPGNPIGYITAEQVNDVERAMAEYMRTNGITGKRILMVHQFQSNMILDKEELDASLPEVELTLSVDGFGNPYVKTSKYNALVDANTPFTSFKLFYGWDKPLMTPREALGVDGTEHTDFIEITPNMIQYQ
ncbi:MAG: hypothetical protein U0X20_22590 [Caldilineaceae bacterium]